MKVRAGGRISTVLLLSVALTACGQSQPAASPLAKWKHGILKPKGDAGFELMAKEKGFFRQHGVDIEFLEFSGNIQLNQALIAGQLDSGEESPDAVLAADASGADLKIIGSTIPGNPFAIYARGGITSFGQLKGKKIGVSQPGSFPEVLTRAMLKAEGVDPNSIVIVNAGADIERYTALKGGKIDAAAASSEFVPQTKADGINVLGYANKIVPMYPRFILAANSRSLKDKADAAVGFLAGEMEGLSYALSHRTETLQLTAKTIDVPADSPGLAFLYDSLKNDGLVSPTSEIPRAKIEWLQNLRVELGLQKERVDLNKVIDESYRTKALKVAKNVGR